MWGDWSCSVRKDVNFRLCGREEVVAEVKFRIERSGPNPVNRQVTNNPVRIRLVDPLLEDGAAAAEVVQAASFLGHADADLGAAAGGGDDVDSWNVQGSAGKPAVVRLEGDATAGYTGGAA